MTPGPVRWKRGYVQSEERMEGGMGGRVTLGTEMEQGPKRLRILKLS